MEKKYFNSKYVRAFQTVFCAAAFLMIAFFLQKEIRKDFAVLKKQFAQSSFSSGFGVDPQVVAKKAQIRTLNRQMPDFDYLIQVFQDKKQFKESLLENHVRYYQRVVEYMPGLPEAWGMLGFTSHFYPKKTQEAIQSYERAIYLNPKFFWFYHNLAMLYFQQQDFARARVVCEQGLNQKSEYAYQFISSSRYIYRQVLHSYFKQAKEDADAQFHRGYDQLTMILLLSYDHLEAYSQMVPAAFKVLEFNKEAGYFYLGKATFHLKQYERSGGFFKLCLQENPYNTDALQYLALNLKAMGKDDAALATLKQMVALIKAHKEKLPQSGPFELEIY